MTEDATIQEPAKTPPAKADPPVDPPKKEPVKLDADPKDSIISEMAKELKTLKEDIAKDKVEADDKDKALIIASIKKAGFKVDGFEKYTLDTLEGIATTLNQKDGDIIITRKKETKDPRKTTVMQPDGSHKDFYASNQSIDTK